MSGGGLVALTVFSVALLLFLILYVRLHAFLALLIASFALGISAGMQPATLLRSIQAGFGEALGFIGIVVALGSIIGRFLEQSGGGNALATAILRGFGPRRARWAVLVSSFLVGLPIFFEVGFIILAPLAWSLARESKRSLLYYGLPIAAALTVTHAMVPPHPAPAAAAQLLGADLGRVILYGAALSVPMAISGGLVYSQWIAKRMFVPVPKRAAVAELASDAAQPPRPSLVALLLVLPLVLICAGTTADRFPAAIRPTLAVLGHPFSALAITALLAMYVLGVRRGLDRGAVAAASAASLAPVGGLLAIMGAGGAFKQVIVDSGVGAYLGRVVADSQLSPLILAYLVASAMRAAQGSATVAIVAAAGIVGPIVKGIPGYSPESIVLALCCGGTILSHVNDAGFWLVSDMFEMTPQRTLKSWTAMKVITSLTGISILVAMQAALR